MALVQYQIKNKEGFAGLASSSAFKSTFPSAWLKRSKCNRGNCGATDQDGSSRNSLGWHYSKRQHPCPYGCFLFFLVSPPCSSKEKGELKKKFKKKKKEVQTASLTNGADSWKWQQNSIRLSNYSELNRRWFFIHKVRELQQTHMVPLANWVLQERQQAACKNWSAKSKWNPLYIPQAAVLLWP